VEPALGALVVQLAFTTKSQRHQESFARQVVAGGCTLIRTSSRFTNPARPMTARPTSPWSFWKENPSAKPSRGGVRQ
jgi:hypothetical protein